ncbi:hypothetical protein SVAN01_05183 [Stagonosporopsis vannaccii]|nr:hypothetical protein SVAN01_05183 [Stagonosporopsis vannaccii]
MLRAKGAEGRWCGSGLDVIMRAGTAQLAWLQASATGSQAGHGACCSSGSPCVDGHAAALVWAGQAGGRGGASQTVCSRDKVPGVLEQKWKTVPCASGISKRMMHRPSCRSHRASWTRLFGCLVAWWQVAGCWLLAAGCLVVGCCCWLPSPPPHHAVRTALGRACRRIVRRRWTESTSTSTSTGELPLQDAPLGSGALASRVRTMVSHGVPGRRLHGGLQTATPSSPPLASPTVQGALSPSPRPRP